MFRVGRYLLSTALIGALTCRLLFVTDDFLGDVQRGADVKGWPVVAHLQPPPPVAESAKRRLPRVACFFMVDKKSTEQAVSVRYAWGNKCAHFVIVTNGAGPEQIDNKTLIVGVDHLIEKELNASGFIPVVGAFSSTDDGHTYTSFPHPDAETKKALTIKSFYSWLFMARRYGNDPDVDYVMKADPDTYMLMDNYLSYLARDFSPTRHAYVGRVFKVAGNYRDPFVTGLSVTLSRATMQLLSRSATIEKNVNNECSAEEFATYGEQDDYAFAQCLQSLGVYPAYTRDSRGRERFMHLSPSQHLGGDSSPDWYDTLSFSPTKPRNACCSDEACAFHYVPPSRQNDTLLWDSVFEMWHWGDSLQNRTDDK